MKKTVLTLLIGLVIDITGTVIASNYLASEIAYKDTTVENALNELYDLSNASVYTGETSITPTEAEQTISSNGKRFTSDITIGAIPNTYKNLTSNTTVIPERLFEGVTAYNNLGELVTGSINPNCVSGTYHHNANTNWSVDFGIKPTKFIFSYILSGTNRLRFYNGTKIYNFSGYDDTSVSSVNVGDGSLNGTVFTMQSSTTTRHYIDVYDVYYMACK